MDPIEWVNLYKILMSHSSIHMQISTGLLIDSRGQRHDETGSFFSSDIYSLLSLSKAAHTWGL